jgi:hypothetical protein
MKNRLRSGLVEAISPIAGVQRVDLISDSALHKITIQTAIGTDLQDRIATVIGNTGMIENVVNREPTLEEAYLNILR